MIRFLFMLAAAACGFVIAGIGFEWSIFDLHDPQLRDDVSGWVGLAALFTALGLAPWNDALLWVKGRRV